MRRTAKLDVPDFRTTTKPLEKAVAVLLRGNSCGGDKRGSPEFPWVEYDDGAMGEFQERKTMATVHQLKPEASPRRRVLLVEDNLDAVHSMAMLVKMMGHEVEFAINGFAALDIARRFRPDVVLLDIGLPDFDGRRSSSSSSGSRISEIPASSRYRRCRRSNTRKPHSKPDVPRSTRSRSTRRFSRNC